MQIYAWWEQESRNWNCKLSRSVSNLYINSFPPHKSKALWLSGNQILAEKKKKKKIVMNNVEVLPFTILYICDQHRNNVFNEVNILCYSIFWIYCIYRLKQHIFSHFLHSPVFPFVKLLEMWIKQLLYLGAFLGLALLFSREVISAPWCSKEMFEKWVQLHGYTGPFQQHTSRTIHSIPQVQLHKPEIVYFRDSVTKPDRLMSNGTTYRWKEKSRWKHPLIESGHAWLQKNNIRQIKGSEGLWHLIFQGSRPRGLIIKQPTALCNLTLPPSRVRFVSLWSVYHHSLASPQWGTGPHTQTLY